MQLAIGTQVRDGVTFGSSQVDVAFFVGNQTMGNPYQPHVIHSRRHFGRRKRGIRKVAGLYPEQVIVVDGLEIEILEIVRQRDTVDMGREWLPILTTHFDVVKTKRPIGSRRVWGML